MLGMTPQWTHPIHSEVVIAAQQVSKSPDSSRNRTIRKPPDYIFILLQKDMNVLLICLDQVLVICI